MANFYDKGLTFQCQGCHYCCSTEPGFVFLSQDDLTRASRYLKLSEDAFIANYCRKVPQGLGFYKISLIEKKNYDCIFLTEKGCSIYPARPSQCKTYPFWPEIMKNEEAWKKEGEGCPGFGKGGCVTKKEIERNLQEHANNIHLLRRF